MSEKKTHGNSSGVTEKSILEALGTQMPESEFNLWIKPLGWEIKNNGSIVALAPDCFFASYIRDKFLDKIQEAVGDVEIVVNERQERVDRKDSGRALATPQSLPGMESYVLRLNPENTFDNFVVDRSNKLAYAICQRIIEKTNSEISGNVFLTGPKGCGKTHLLQATARMMAKSNQVVCVTADQFGKEFVSAILAKSGNKMDVFNKKYTSCDILFLDDIQEIAGRKKTIIALCSAVTVLQDKGMIVISTSYLSRPKLAQVLDKKLVRLLTGLILTVKASTEKIRARIIQHQAEKMGIILEDHWVEYLVRSLDDPSKIKTALRGLKARLSVFSSLISEMIREVVEEQVNSLHSSSSLTLEGIAKVVRHFYNIKEEDFSDKSRKATPVLARKVFAFLARKHTTATLEEIGAVVGRDHSSIGKYVEYIENFLETDSSFRRQFELIKNKLKI